jgi:hypothetical protein
MRSRRYGLFIKEPALSSYMRIAMREIVNQVPIIPDGSIVGEWLSKKR